MPLGELAGDKRVPLAAGLWNIEQPLANPTVIEQIATWIAAISMSAIKHLRRSAGGNTLIVIESGNRVRRWEGVQGVTTGKIGSDDSETEKNIEIKQLRIKG